MKRENDGQIIKQSVDLKSKMYSIDIKMSIKTKKIKFMIFIFRVCHELQQLLKKYFINLTHWALPMVLAVLNPQSKLLP